MAPSSGQPHKYKFLSYLITLKPNSSTTSNSTIPTIQAEMSFSRCPHQGKCINEIDQRHDQLEPEIEEKVVALEFVFGKLFISFFKG